MGADGRGDSSKRWCPNGHGSLTYCECHCCWLAHVHETEPLRRGSLNEVRPGAAASKKPESTV